MAKAEMVLTVTVKADILRKLLELADPKSDPEPGPVVGTSTYARWEGRKEIRDKLLDILTSTGYGSAEEESP